MCEKGANIGQDVNIFDAAIDIGTSFLLIIGNNATRSTGDHPGTIPGTDAGAGDRIQTPDPGSAAHRFPVKHCAKQRK